MPPPTKYIGVDVAKAYLEMDLPKPNHRIANTPEAIASLLQRLPSAAHLVCEATGGYERALLEAAHQAGVPISVLLPQRVRHHARSQGRLAKTDRLDAALLTDYGVKHRPAARVRPDSIRLRMRELLRARAHLLELQKLEVNWQEHPDEEPLLIEQARLRRELLDQQVRQIEQALRKLAAHPQLAASLQRLQQLKGVGEITAWTVWAEMPELGTLAPGQPAAIAGLAPHPNDSGRYSGKRPIQPGRCQLRRVLYMAAVTAACHNPVLKRFYGSLRSRGKPAKLALIATARRLIETLNLLLKNPNFLLAQ